jgi:3-dehydroquinate dehydratase-2
VNGGKMKFLILNGPNLNMLGRRNRQIYGTLTLEQINGEIAAAYPGDTFDFYQSNHEGDLIDKIHELYAPGGTCDGLVINPGAFAHYSYAIHDALEACPVPAIEVHLSNIYEREQFRRVSVTAPACLTVISGQGMKGYIEAVQQLKERTRS